MSKEYLANKIICSYAQMRRTITDDLVTGYRFAGIEQAAALHRLLYGT